MRLTVVPMNDSYSYRIQTKTERQSYTMLINKVLLRMGSDPAKEDCGGKKKKCPVEVCSFGLCSLMTMFQLPASSKRNVV